MYSMPCCPSVRLAVGALALLLVSACADERDPVDRTQPNGVLKSDLNGEWYYGRTVVDVPASDSFTFVGGTDFNGLSRIRWDIQEDMLYARRTTELIKNADDKQTQKERYAGEVIAAFPIEKHFDIVHAYNPTTGEQLNVLEENATDRPWFERAYIRVDWSENKVHNYQLDWETQSVEGVPYFVQEVDPVTGRRHPDAPVFDREGSTLVYFDVTNKLFARAGTTELPGYGQIPLCWLRGNEFQECGAGEYTVRHSFKRVDPNNDYQPQKYKGKATEVFGFFTTDRMVYDSKTGIRIQTNERYLNRHNLWKHWKGEDGKLLPYAERELRPIVYYANVDLPEDLKPVAQKVADQWNDVFVQTVRALGHEPKGRVFVFCPNNPVRDGDPSECGPVGLSPRIGDIRYSFMAYVPKYMKYGLLGLGPANTDPETGEILSGMAYVYHHNNLAAYRTQEMVELLNGDKKPQEYLDGVDLTDWVNQVNDNKLTSNTFGLEDAQYMVSRIAHGPAAAFWETLRQAPTALDEEAQRTKGFRPWVEPYLADLYARGMHNGEKHRAQGKLAKLQGTELESLLLDPEILMASGHTPGAPVTDAVKARASIARGGFGRFMRERGKALDAWADKRNLYLAEMADDALIGLARELKGRPSAEVYDTLRTTIYTAVLTHEVGHSLGLMHNFGGSDDAVNYHDEYWRIRAEDGVVGPRLEDPITDNELNKKLYNYAYSSVMDYAGRYTVDGAGVGKYDRAAILFGYGNKVEVFRDTVGVDPTWFRDWFETDGDIIRFQALRPMAVHYTAFFNAMKEKLYSADNRMWVDVDTLTEDFSTSFVDNEARVRVPYIYCSHSRSDISDSCLTRDAGADTSERMKNILDDLSTWYIARNFPRGQVGVDNFNYVSTYYRRIYDRLKGWHDLYGLYVDLLPRFYAPTQLQAFLTDPVTGWGAKTWAVQNAFNYLVQTVLMPDIGGYAGPVPNADGSSVYKLGYSPVTLNLDVTQGRYYATSWFEDSRECGYTWWECLHHVGFYLDKIMAIEALSDSETNFVGRSTPEDLRQWEVSYYNTFGEQLGKLNEAMLSGDWSKVGPYAENGRLRFPNYAGQLTETHLAPVDPYATFSVQLYWQVLGQARFFDNYDQSFRDQSRIFVLGTGAAPDVPANELVTVRDPTTGLRYGALRLPSGTPGGARGLVEKAQRLLARSSYCDASLGTPETTDDCVPPSSFVGQVATTRELRDTLELIKVMADLSPVMSYGDPYNP